VKDFAHAGAVEAVVDEVLTHGNAVFAPVATAHEGASGRAASRALAVGSLEDHALLREGVDVGRLHDLVTVDAEGRGLQIVGDEKEHILDFRSSGHRGERETREESEEG